MKAWVLKSLEELDSIKEEVLSGNIVILRLGKLAEKNMEDVKKAVNELYDFAQQIDGDIARLGEERIVVTPPFVKIWRGKTST
ncbi:cell division protein SepF [Candidatus Bathyarchaeota archaeon]|nr:cell division protein SepF [Candidatus Bathyarchaeota archaeon]